MNQLVAVDASDPSKSIDLLCIHYSQVQYHMEYKRIKRFIGILLPFRPTECIIPIPRIKKEGFIIIIHIPHPCVSLIWYPICHSFLNRKKNVKMMECKYLGRILTTWGRRYIRYISSFHQIEKLQGCLLSHGFVNWFGLVLLWYHILLIIGI